MTDDQKKQISVQLAEGASIADIQRLINDDFKIHMTYMDVRFLMDDLNLDLAPPPEPEAEDEAETVEPSHTEATHTGGAQVEVDRIMRPGAAVSGTVTFSDGQGAIWYVSPEGQLGLDPNTEGYQPSPEDVQAFQSELRSQMQGPGA